MIHFMKYRAICALMSFLFVIGLAGLCIYRIQTRGSAFVYSIDFTGGTQLLLDVKGVDFSSDECARALAQNGFEGVFVRKFSDSEVQVRVKEFSDDPAAAAQRVIQTLRTAYPDINVTLLQTDAVGPAVGLELQWKFMKAVAIVLIMLLFYIALRFLSFGFGAGAVVALLHDIIMMVGLLLIFDREISINVVGAMLAVLGYSINDTIVIFSQIRKNIESLRNVPIDQIVDISLNQTLKRTMLTSISTGLVVIAMILFSPASLRDFSLAWMVGIIFGTYSSIYIASAIMILFYKDEKKNIIS